MDANRLTRITVAGWALILSWPLQSWILGADLGWMTKLLASIQTVPQATAVFLVGLAAGPFLGLFVSSFAGFVIQEYRGGSTQFDVPTDDRQLRRFSTALRRLLPTTEFIDELKAIEDRLPVNSAEAEPMSKRQLKKHTDTFEPYFNLLYHTQASPTLIDYTTRRWTIYWMYANSICAVLIGTGLSLIMSGRFWTRDPALEPAAIEGALALFVVFGVRRLGEMRKQVLEIAWLWVYEKARC